MSEASDAKFLHIVREGRMDWSCLPGAWEVLVAAHVRHKPLTV